MYVTFCTVDKDEVTLTLNSSNNKLIILSNIFIGSSPPTLFVATCAITPAILLFHAHLAFDVLLLTQTMQIGDVISLKSNQTLQSSSPFGNNM